MNAVLAAKPMTLLDHAVIEREPEFVPAVDWSAVLREAAKQTAFHRRHQRIAEGLFDFHHDMAEAFEALAVAAIANGGRP